MTTLFQNARKAFLMLASGLALLSSQLFALEISDISYPLTRDEADKTLSKDYTYAMLADGTVRRTWKIDNRSVFIDFDTNTNEALLIAIIYQKPVSKKEGIADAHELGKGKFSEEAKWDSPKDKASRELISDTFGLQNAKRKKLEDKAMLFYETNDKGTKVTRVSLFSHLPKNNRWELDTITPGAKKTALGTNWGDEYVEDVYKDEARRQEIPLASTTTSASAADASSAGTGADSTTAASDSATTTTVTIKRPVRTPSRNRVTAMGTRAGGEYDDDTTTTSTSTSIQPPTAINKQILGQDGSTQVVSTLPPAPDFLKNFGIEQPEWWHYIALGIGLLIILFMIFRSMAKAKQRAAHQKQYAQILSGKGIRK